MAPYGRYGKLPERKAIWVAITKLQIVKHEGPKDDHERQRISLLDNV
jgi:hypothetical protein